MTHKIIPFVLLILFATAALAQNVGVGTNSPNTKLDVAGAITHEETSLTMANGANALTSNVSQIKLVHGTETSAFSLSGPTTAITGQMLAIYNTTAFAATFTNAGSTIIPAGTAMSFIYSNATWVATSPASSGSTGYIQNQNSYIQSGTYRINGGAYVGGNDTVGGGLLNMTNGTSNTIAYNTNGVAIPAFTTSSAGTKITFYPQETSTSVDYAVGVASGTLWHSVPVGSSTYFHSFYGGTTELMRIQGNGFVGIGSTSPATYLQLGNTNNLANSYITFTVGNTTLGTNRTWQIGVPYGGSTTTSPNYGFAITDANVSTSVTAASTPFTIDFNTHNIGINDVAPTVPLEVMGGVSAGLNQVLQLAGGSNANASGPAMVFQQAWGSSSNASYPTWAVGEIGSIYNNTTSYGGDMVFYTNSGSSATSISERMRILYNGNVGIGLTGPGQALEVVNNNAIKIGDAYLSSGGNGVSGTNYMHLANDEYYSSGSWVQPISTTGVLYQQLGQVHNWYTHTAGSTTHTLQMSLSATGVLSLPQLGTTALPVYVNSSSQLTTSAPTSGAIGYWTASGSYLYNNTGTYVGIGNTVPIATLDVLGQGSARSGTAPTSPAVYFTATLPSGDAGPASGDIEFRHANQSEGIGFGYQAIYATGSNTNQALDILSRGTSAITLNGYSYSTGGVSVGNSSPGSNLLNVSSSVTNGYGIVLSAETAAPYTGGGGSVSINGGPAYTGVNYGNSGGSVSLTAGNAYQTTGSGTGGNINLTAGGNYGNSTNSGNINFYATVGTTVSQAMIIQGSNGAVGIGGLTAVPKQSSGTGIGLAMFAMDGANGSSSGPHIQYTTASDAYPVFQQLNWSHDNVSQCYDCYYTGSAWTTAGSSSQTPIQVYKIGSVLYFRSAAAAAAGSSISAWNNMLTMSSSGVAIGASGTNFNSIQSGSYTLSTSSGGVYITGTISFPNAFPSGVTPNIICTMNSAPTSNYNDTYVVHVRSKTNTGFVANIYRVDSAGGGWGQTPSINWIAWY